MNNSIQQLSQEFVLKIYKKMCEELGDIDKLTTALFKDCSV